MSFVNNVIKHRQQILNAGIVVISVNMYAQNLKIGKLWNGLTVMENELKKQYESYENMTKDSEWLLSVENRVIKSASQKQQSKNNKDSTSLSILQLEIHEKSPNLFLHTDKPQNLKEDPNL